jgi:hypothetical protein
MTVPDLLPGARWRPISYREEAGRFTQTPLGWILHVVVGNGSPFNTFQNAVSPGRRFSHLWVSKIGATEQYQLLSWKSWAQGVGNPTWWAIETEGFPGEPLTSEQIKELARIHKVLGAPNLLAEAPGQRGIGTHYMGGVAWGNHSCPDPSPGVGPRSKQREAILTLAAASQPASPIPTLPATTPAPKPSPGTDPRRVARLQQLLELVADGKWGSDTDRRGSAMRAVIHSGVRDAANVLVVQRVVDTAQDGIWGSRTSAAATAWTRQLQTVLAVGVDGAWGPLTDRAYLALRTANLNRF